MVFCGLVHRFWLAIIPSWFSGSRRCGRQPVNRYIRLFCTMNNSCGFWQHLVCGSRRKTGESHLFLVRRPLGLPILSLLVDNFFLEHPVNFRHHKLSCRWSGSVWCTAHWADNVASEFDTVFCVRERPRWSSHMFANISKTLESQNYVLFICWLSLLFRTSRC